MKRIIGALSIVMMCVVVPANAGWWDDFWNAGKGLMDEVSQTRKDKTGLSKANIAAGLKQALSLSSQQVIDYLARPDGYLADPHVHIPLPEELQQAQTLLSTIGLGSVGQDLERRMNRAAEAAIPHAKEIFLASIKQMTLDDARKILQGPPNAATVYFKRRMTPSLVQKITPLVDKALADAGAVKAYNMMSGGLKQWAKNPFVNTYAPQLKTNLTDYTVRKTLDGVFYYLAIEEAAIRRNPAKRTTELMQKVFKR